MTRAGLLPLPRVKSNSLLTAAASVLWLALAGCQSGQNSRSVSGTIETDEARVASRYGGRVEKTFAQEGDGLSGGQVIVELDAGELSARRDQLAAQLAEAVAGSEERRVGKECGYQCRSRWSPYH